MFRSRSLSLGELLLLACLVLSPSFSARAQGLRTVIEPRNKVFPQTEAGVTAIKRSPAGLYYVLAKPGNSISVYGAEGDLVNRIPNAKSNGATIRYAADLDVSPDGLVVVADRGANAIEVFRPDGSLVSRVAVAAPTSVVALSNDLFAVTSLVSKRLVQVIDDRGKVIRSFGDPGDLSDTDTPPEKKEALADWGTISGDSAGGIYFAFTSVPDPTLRKYDRYGYLGYQASVPKEMFSIGGTQPSDRVEVSFGFSDVSLSDQTTGWVSLGSSTDLKFGGGVGTGLSQAIQRGFGPAAFQQTMAQPGGGGPVGATFSGEVTPQGNTNFQLGMGRMSSFGGRGRGSSSAFSNQSNSQGGILQFSSGDNGTSDSDSSDWSQVTGASGTTAELGMSGSSGTGDSDPSANPAGTANPAWGLGGLPGGFVFGSAIHSFGFRQPGFAGGGGGFDRPPGGYGFGHPPGGAGTGSATTGGMGADDFSHGGYHGHFRPGMFAFTGVVRVNLGDLGRVSRVDKPAISAMAADPETQEIWAGIGDTLVHFSKDGAPMGIYYLALNGGTPLKPTALLIESNRIVVAADPWGIFEFARPDKPSTQQQLNVVPQVTQPQ